VDTGPSGFDGSGFGDGAAVSSGSGSGGDGNPGPSRSGRPKAERASDFAMRLRLT